MWFIFGIAAQRRLNMLFAFNRLHAYSAHYAKLDFDDKVQMALKTWPPHQIDTLLFTPSAQIYPAVCCCCLRWCNSHGGTVHFCTKLSRNSGSSGLSKQQRIIDILPGECWYGRTQYTTPTDQLADTMLAARVNYILNNYELRAHAFVRWDEWSKAHTFRSCSTGKTENCRPPKFLRRGRKALAQKACSTATLGWVKINITCIIMRRVCYIEKMRVWTCERLDGLFVGQLLVFERN